MRQILRGLAEHQAATDPRSDDTRLRGRTYAIPFDLVWRASVALCGGGLRGWRLLSADDERGVIEAVSTPLLPIFDDDVRVEIRLDENAQTRVDLWSAAQKNRPHLGRNRRVIGHFLRSLDRSLDAPPGQILDPLDMTEWLETS